MKGKWPKGRNWGPEMRRETEFRPGKGQQFDMRNVKGKIVLIWVYVNNRQRLGRLPFSVYVKVEKKKNIFFHWHQKEKYLPEKVLK